MDKETIEKLRSLIEDEELIESEEVEDLEKFRKKSTENNVRLGMLYLKCYNILIQNRIRFKSVEKFTKHLDEINVDKQFEKNIQYYNSNGFGKYATEKRIEEYVIKNKKDINSLIDLFFEIFKEEL